MVRLSFLFAFLLFSAFSCSKEDEEHVNPLERYPSYISKVEAPEAVTVGSTVPITIFFSVNNGCGYFGSFDVEKKDGITYVKVFPKYRDGMCTMDIPTRQVVYDFKPTTVGTYVFKFLPVYPDQAITKTIVVTSDHR